MMKAPTLVMFACFVTALFSLALVSAKAQQDCIDEGGQWKTGMYFGYRICEQYKCRWTQFTNIVGKIDCDRIYPSENTTGACCDTEPMGEVVDGCSQSECPSVALCTHCWEDGRLDYCGATGWNNTPHMICEWQCASGACCDNITHKFRPNAYDCSGSATECLADKCTKIVYPRSYCTGTDTMCWLGSLRTANVPAGKVCNSSASTFSEVDANTSSLACDESFDYWANEGECTYEQRYAECNGMGTCDLDAAVYYSSVTKNVPNGSVAISQRGGRTLPYSTSAKCGTNDTCNGAGKCGCSLFTKQCVDNQVRTYACGELWGVEDCGNTTCGLWGDNYCGGAGNDVYHIRNCSEKGCASGVCFTAAREEEALVEKCETGKCTDWGATYCVGNSTYHKRTCITGSCQAGACASQEEESMVEACPSGMVCASDPDTGCKCGDKIYDVGFCCNDKYSESPCESQTPFTSLSPWNILIIAGVVLVVAVAGFFFFTSREK